MESFKNTGYAGEIERAKLRENKTLYENFVHRMCSESTFIQVHMDCQKY